jgi:phage terminase large subunit-like protein
VLGIRLGQWQSYVLDRMLRYDRNGDLIHRVALLSTGRQNGKSVVVRSLIGWMLDEGHELDAFKGWTTILAAAHDAKQARIVYRGVQADFESVPRLKAASRISGYRGIQKDGLLFDVVTAQPGSARGLSAGAVAWDEVVTQKDFAMWEALSPTQSAQRSPLMVLTSTAGFEDSVLLRSFHDKLRRQASGDEKPDRTFYGAWWQSEEPDAGLDWKQIRQANPALRDGRLSKQAIVTEHGLLPADSWRRERLNHFVDSRSANAAFRPGVWAACRVREPLADVPAPYALGIGVSPGWERASLAVAAIRPDGRIGVEIYRDFRDGVTPAQVVAAVETFSIEQRPQAIAYDASSGGAGEFKRTGEETGQAYDGLKPAAVVAATMDVAEMIMAGRLAVDDPLLDAQLPNVVKRPIGADGAFRFGRQASLGPIDAIEAMTFAAHAIAYRPRMPNIH